jgi:hypothetical protein
MKNKDLTRVFAFSSLSIFLFFALYSLTAMQKRTPANLPANNVAVTDSIEVVGRALAQEQLDAYNARDIEAFLVPYSDSVKVFSFPNTLLFEGKQAMRERYGKMFASTPDLYCHLVSRMIQGNTVIDQELVTRQKNAPKAEAIAIYKIAHGKIQEVYFISK